MKPVRAFVLAASLAASGLAFAAEIPPDGQYVGIVRMDRQGGGSRLRTMAKVAARIHRDGHAEILIAGPTIITAPGDSVGNLLNGTFTVENGVRIFTLPGYNVGASGQGKVVKLTFATNASGSNELVLEFVLRHVQ